MRPKRSFRAASPLEHAGEAGGAASDTGGDQDHNLVLDVDINELSRIGTDDADETHASGYGAETDLAQQASSPPGPAKRPRRQASMGRAAGSLPDASVLDDAQPARHTKRKSLPTSRNATAATTSSPQAPATTGKTKAGQCIRSWWCKKHYKHPGRCPKMPDGATEPE
jgi:hypothetical protein